MSTSISNTTPRHKKRKVYWRGQHWNIIEVLDDNDTTYIREGDVGRINPDKGYLAFRTRAPDIEIKVLLHELLHEALPNIEEKDIEAAEIPIKTFLEALGVNLRPLLKGYKKCSDTESS